MECIYTQELRRSYETPHITRTGSRGAMSETYGIYEIHEKTDCTGPCPFHNPSDHPLKDAEINIRMDKSGLVERICEHGVGHDDPDSVAYFHSIDEKWAGVHGCDGCCYDDKSEKTINTEKVSRLEVIDEAGRAYVKGLIYGTPVKVELSVQDNGRTLKIFVQERPK